jgi:phospholipase C
MYVVSPWSKGGWVCSQVFDHTSVAQFIERRFDVTIPAITPWHRAICGDLTSAFDFVNPNDPSVPMLPDQRNYAEIEAKSNPLPVGRAPAIPQPLYQEQGLRYSRALPYEFDVSAQEGVDGTIALKFRNTGKQGVVLHVYDKLHLDRIPRRYSIEAGKELADDFWDANASDAERYDLWVYGPNGFVRTFKGTTAPGTPPVKTEIELSYDPTNAVLSLKIRGEGAGEATFTITANAYRSDGPWTLTVPAGQIAEHRWSVTDSGNWYDFTVAGPIGFERRFAGRLETGRHGISDPAMAKHLLPIAGSPT